MRELTYTEAVLEAFREEMRRDPTVFHLCGGLGALASLIPEFGEERVRVCPISEDAYVGASIGAAGSGSPERQLHGEPRQLEEVNNGQERKD